MQRLAKYEWAVLNVQPIRIFYWYVPQMRLITTN